MMIKKIILKKLKEIYPVVLYLYFWVYTIIHKHQQILDFFIDEINNLFVFYRYDSRKTSSIRKSILDRAR